MKKTLAICLSMAVLLCAVPHMAFAATTVSVDGITYELNDSDKTATLTSGTSASGDLAIPGSVSDGYTVTSIGNGAFSSCSGLTSVTIPGSVTAIGNYAFRWCSKLTSVEIPDSVTTIGEMAFYYCSGLTSITIPDSVTAIGNSAFDHCHNLWSIKIPSSVTTIGEKAFSSCSSLTSVTIGNGVTTIGQCAFQYCSSLTSVVLGSGVESISNSIKSNLLSLDTLTTINVDSANPNFKFNDGVLFNKDGTELVLYPQSKTGSSYDIPSGVKSIGDYAFYGCRKLTSITVPGSATAIGDCAFYNSGLSLGTINVDSNPNLEVKDDVLFNNADASLVLCSKDKTGNYDIPSNITNICGGAFASCSKLTSVTIPHGVTAIGDYTFSYCSGLTSVEIPDSVTTIGDYAFRSCSGLTSVEIPDSVTTIGKDAFFYCTSLRSVTIGSGVTTIGSGAFHGCSGLTSVTIPDSVTTIGNNAFDGCSGLTSVTIPDSVTTIGNNAFDGCSGLTSVTIGSGVTTIGNSAFQSCSKLTSVTIPCNFDPGKFDGTRIIVGDNNTFTIEWYSGSGGTFVISHDINKVERREPDCVNDGKDEHYKCSGCNTLYDDADGENIISEDSLKLKALGHDIQKVERREPDCANDGEEEHYKCKRCGALFSDEAGTKSVTADELKLKAQGHDWDAGEVTTAATPEKPGVKTYTCSVCGETKTEPVEYVSVPGGGDGDSTDLQPGTTGGDSSSTNSSSDAEPAVMAKRVTIKTGDQLGLWLVFDMALLLISVYGVLVGLGSRRKRDNL